MPIRRKGENYNPALMRKHHHPRLSPDKTLVTSQLNDTTYDHGVHEYATIGVKGNFLEAQAKINLWKPFIEADELSISQIWVATLDKDINTIEVGWEEDGYVNTGCYNLLCDGFVHTSSNVSLGCSFSEVSTFNDDQKDVTFIIHKWTLVDTITRYSNRLLSKFSLHGIIKSSNNSIRGGEIIDRTKGRHTSTQMGSGHFPSEGGLKTSSYFNWVQVIDEDNAMKNPENVETYITNPNCYDLKITDDNYDTNGYSFYYGDPDYNDRCQ
ncbi:uncharacterized protein LOC113311302 [Papaver somniferum]|uniref:uncharacterized protein LOC113311302 n=1 Tax=Papaver somniferum TaxID=3469 RepID=UPI000E7007FC|nr:uncharacterized protein LOC113311302 [Papaver somniferum]